MTSTTVSVDGMTCEHCVRAVTEEVGAVAGVTSVVVDLQPGAASAVTVTSEGEADVAAIAAAVAEAGYTLT